MTLESKRTLVGLLGLLFVGALVAVAVEDAHRRGAEAGRGPPVVPVASAGCVSCHTKTSPLIVAQWGASAHAQKGIACLECHGAKEDEPGNFMHHDARMTVLVTPTKCGRCHKDEAAQMASSPHGKPIPGFEVKLSATGLPVAGSWPLPDVGRLNPDGSAGSCAACHGRHDIDLESARRPEVCESCHRADGSAEAWRRSAHGGQAAANDERVIHGPVCATCHMSATINAKATHDVSLRVTWELGTEGRFKQRPNADARRDAMYDACERCHSTTFLDPAFKRIDGTFEKASEIVESHRGQLFGLRGSWPHLSVVDRTLLER